MTGGSRYCTESVGRDRTSYGDHLSTSLVEFAASPVLGHGPCKASLTGTPAPGRAPQGLRLRHAATDAAAARPRSPVIFALRIHQAPAKMMTASKMAVWEGAYSTPRTRSNEPAPKKTMGIPMKGRYGRSSGGRRRYRRWKMPAVVRRKNVNSAMPGKGRRLADPLGSCFGVYLLVGRE